MVYNQPSSFQRKSEFTNYTRFSLHTCTSTQTRSHSLSPLSLLLAVSHPLESQGGETIGARTIGQPKKWYSTKGNNSRTIGFQYLYFIISFSIFLYIYIFFVRFSFIQNLQIYILGKFEKTDSKIGTDHCANYVYRVQVFFVFLIILIVSFRSKQILFLFVYRYYILFCYFFFFFGFSFAYFFSVFSFQ